MGSPKQEYWSGLPFLSPRDLSHPGIEPTSPALAGRFLTTEPSGIATGIGGVWRADLNTHTHTFYFGVRPINNVVTVSGEQQRDSAIHMFILTFSFYF